MKPIIPCIALALALMPAIAAAGVDPKIGNFYITYADIEQTKGGHELSTYRTYNSKVKRSGWYGVGWGTPFETRLLVMPDGSAMVKENGSGQTNYYFPEGGANVPVGVDRMVAEIKKRDKLAPEAAETLRGKLLADLETRLVTTEKYGIESQLPAGGTVLSSECDEAAITRVSSEYRRTTCGEGTDFFNMAGQLVRHEDDDYKFTIHYAGKYPDKIEDSLGQKLFLKWTTAGNVAEARAGKDAQVFSYKYNDKGELIFSKSSGGNSYSYTYDGNSHLTKIGYIDNTSMDMQYNERGFAASVTERDRSKTTYSYREDPANPTNHYWTTITDVSEDGTRSSREIEFSLTADANGVEQLAALHTTTDEAQRDIEFDEQGRIKRFHKPDGGFSEYLYHPTFNKISAVLTEEGRTDYQYNATGDLTRINSSEGQVVKLEYDAKKHISRMVESNKTKDTLRELTFEYNAQNKPITVKLLGKGEINVVYDEEGEVVSVDSKEGSVMALEVTSAFTTLLRLVKEGGVDLGM